MTIRKRARYFSIIKYQNTPVAERLCDRLAEYLLLIRIRPFGFVKREFSVFDTTRSENLQKCSGKKTLFEFIGHKASLIVNCTLF